MFCYEVTAAVEDRLRAEFEDYMLAKHIAEVLETGCFFRARFSRSGDNYSTAYIAHDRAEINRYLENFTQAMRDDFMVHFPAGIELSRSIYEE